MSDLRARLSSALQPQYTLERELSGGGMSRVFVAREEALGRTVVLKVLPPELEGINLDRFRREIQLAARLHHPHIVPLHAAGVADGVPYYTMPLVEGESLRARLDRAGPLPIAEVVQLLGDVAEALSYAHQRGVVHRDIKPDNVLLGDGHALVTDFGVAKAVSDATAAHAEGFGSGTGFGVAIGTPAYMAPEQAAGDPAMDHRADLYALGLLGYEMLTGQSPFGRRASPQEHMAAQLAATPRPVTELRPDTPLLLASLIMRCLEKRPEDRPASAAAVREMLRAMQTPSGGASSAVMVAPRTWHRRGVALAALAIVGAAIGAMLWTRATVKPLDANVVAVVPFQMVSPGGPTYLREGIVDLFSAELTGEGSPRAADPRSVLRAWERAAGTDTGTLSRENALRVAESLGAGQLLTGEITGTDTLLLSAHLLDVRAGRLVADAQARGPAESLPALIDSLTMKLLAIRQGEGSRLAALTSTSLPALRAYLSGQWLYRRGKYEEATKAYDRAITEDSTFALAAAQMVLSSVWYGDYAARNKAASIAWAHRDRLSARDLAFLYAQVGMDYPRTPSNAEALQLSQKYLALAPDRADAWFDVGDAMFHFGASVGVTNAHAQAEEDFRRALDLDSAFVPALEHIVLLAAERGDTAAAERYARLYFAADSSGESGAAIRWRLAALRGDARVADSVAHLGVALPATSQAVIGWIGLIDGFMPRTSYYMLGALADSMARSGDPGAEMFRHEIAMLEGRPHEAAQHAATYWRTSGRGYGPERDFIKDALEGVGSVALADSASRVLAPELASPTPRPSPDDQKAMQSAAFWVGSQCLVGLWRTMNAGDTSGAPAASARLRKLASYVPTQGLGGYASDCATLLDAAVAVRTHAPNARVLLVRADSLMRTGPTNAVSEFGNSVVARLFEASGDRQAALAAIRRRGYLWGRQHFLGATYRDEGRIAAELGMKGDAIAAYRHYLTLNVDPEPEVAREMDMVRGEIARLEREGSGR